MTDSTAVSQSKFNLHRRREREVGSSFKVTTLATVLAERQFAKIRSTGNGALQRAPASMGPPTRREGECAS